MKTQIKVTDTRMHKVSNKLTSSGNLLYKEDVPVIEGEVAFLINPMDESISDCSLWRDRDKIKTIFINNLDNPFELVRDYDPINPTIISKTENIALNDWFVVNGTIQQCVGFLNDDIEASNGLPYQRFACHKILAFRHQLSPKHIEAFTKGKIKDGDKVLVECERKPEPEYENIVITSRYDFIKLNPQSHVTLIRLKKKMVSELKVRELVKIIQDKAEYNAHQDVGTGHCFTKKYDAFLDAFDVEKWFEENLL